MKKGNSQKTSVADTLHTLNERIRKLRRSPTLDGIYTLWYEELSRTLKSGTLNKISSLFYIHVLSEDRDGIRLSRLTPLAAQKIFIDPLLTEEKYVTAGNVVVNLLSLCDFAVAVGILDSNPIKEIRNLPQIKKATRMACSRVRHRKAFGYEHINRDLHNLFKTFALKENIRCRLLLEIGFHLLLRPGELVKIRIENYDPISHTLTVYATKTLPQFKIPLNSISETLICIAIRLLSKGGWIFGSPIERYGKPAHLSVQLLNTALKRNGFGDSLCAHGIRGTFSTWASMRPNDISFIAKEACLQHQVSSRVEQAYRHDDHFLVYRRSAMLKWSKYLESMAKQNSVIQDESVKDVCTDLINKLKITE